MQFFAWTEHTKEAKHALRQSHRPPKQQKLLQGTPIFCFETAIKLLYWCGFVYEHDEVRPCYLLETDFLYLFPAAVMNTLFQKREAAVFCEAVDS